MGFWVEQPAFLGKSPPTPETFTSPPPPPPPQDALREAAADPLPSAGWSCQGLSGGPGLNMGVYENKGPL